MGQVERNKEILAKYIPAKSVDLIAEWVYRYNFKLKIKKSRSTKLGDYRPPINNTNHQITINNDLNEYTFLITLIHEIAHLSNWEKHKNRVKPHGEEWKNEFKILMCNFLNEEIFAPDIIDALVNYMMDPSASSCSDLGLLRVLKKYDARNGFVLLEEIEINSIFKISTGRYFIKGEKIRKRYKCMEVKTNRAYLFNPLSEVLVINKGL